MPIKDKELRYAYQREWARKRKLRETPEERARRLAAHALWRSRNQEYFEAYRKDNAAHEREMKRERRRRNAQKYRDYANAYTRAKRAENPEPFRAKDRQRKRRVTDVTRAHNARRRAALRGVSGRGVSGSQWLEIITEYGGRCAYCACVMVKATMDHAIPISKDGQHDTENVVPACETCNKSKGKDLHIVWLAKRARRWRPRGRKSDPEGQGPKPVLDVAEIRGYVVGG